MIKTILLAEALAAAAQITLGLVAGSRKSSGAGERR
jgi:hypothetical protein